jgi:hypothetical protein
MLDTAVVEHWRFIEVRERLVGMDQKSGRAKIDAPVWSNV